MIYFAACFFVSLLAARLIIRSSIRHGQYSADHDFDGPQKFHAKAVPRIGGVGIFVAALFGASLIQLNEEPERTGMWFFLVASLPAFIAGLVEDLTKKVSARRRLFFTAISAVLGIYLLNALVQRTSIPGLDNLITFPVVAIAVTIFLVTGFTHAVNIIDGFNGLASMCIFIMLLALAHVSHVVGDTLILKASLITAGAVLGFFIWNFPSGLIFLGDGGAYFLGFLIAELSILLVGRNADVSPMFPVLVCAYPFFETIFTIYRRKVLKGSSAGLPDGIHLHTLIHRRVIKQPNHECRERRQTARNSMTSPYLWLLSILSVIPAVLWWDQTGVLVIFQLLFIFSYLFVYRTIVKFKVPRWISRY
jgi:UDP-N-acetylmuramyl pentapeptide phosphotransferase/UDP-N-acetylglucosamine-1-phosphate transferase